jgi:hypothetical protein
LPWTCVEKAGGHEIFADEVVKVAAFFAQQQRDLYRPRVWARMGGLRFDTAEANPKWDKTHTWTAGRPIELSTVHWLQFFDLPAGTPPEKGLQRAFVERKDGNRIEITSENVRRLRLHLHPRLVDFGKPVVVVANGKQVFSGTVTPDLGLMLTLVRAYADRGRVFHAAVDVDIADDQKPPDPRG